MAHRRKIIAWGVGLGLLLGVAQTARPDESAKPQTVSIDAEHEPLLTVIKRICVAQGLNFVANDAALERAGKVSLSLHDVPLETALDVICEAYNLEARVKNRILMVRPRAEANGQAPSEPARRNRYLPEEKRGEERRDEAPATGDKPSSTRIERDPSPASAKGDAAPISTVAIAADRSTPASQMVGTVVEVGKDTIKVKETSGDPREFAIAQSALRRLKPGDRIAFEYRVVEGRAVITNLVGGGNPQQKP